MKKFNFLTDFFYAFPALFFALFFLIGIFSCLYKNFFFLIFLICTWSKKSFFFALFTFLFAFFYCSFFYSNIKKIPSPIEGIGYFKISDIKKRYSFKKPYYTYQGKLKSFKTKNNVYRNISCSIFSLKKYEAQYSYKIKGELLQKENFRFYLKTKNIWEKDHLVHSFAKKRYELKRKFQKFLNFCFLDKNSASFLHTLLTGEKNNRFLTFSFSKIGLQHVIAISGFHFSILTIFFACFLKLFLSQRLVVWTLLILVNLYFLFLGPLISVQRAYIMILLALFAQIVNRRYFALNALGISLIIILFINPLNIANIGFQLSFLSSFAILLSFPWIEENFSKIIKKRTSLEKTELSYISRLGEKLLVYIRQCIALCISVNIFILPVILYHFHKFAYLSFIYNLFIPFLVGISMTLTILTMLFQFILPPISLAISYINSFFTKCLLNLIIYPPASLQFYLRYKNLSFEFVVSYLIALTIFFIILRYYSKNKQTPDYFRFL